jgi:hypothetical protein
LKTGVTLKGEFNMLKLICGWDPLIGLLKQEVRQKGFLVPDKLPEEIWDLVDHTEISDDETEFQILDRFSQLLQAQGLLVKEGSIVDASFVAAPRQRNSRKQNEQIKQGQRPEAFDPKTLLGRQQDCEARWAKKNHEVHYAQGKRINEPIKSKNQSL